MERTVPAKQSRAERFHQERQVIREIKDLAKDEQLTTWEGQESSLHADNSIYGSIGGNLPINRWSLGSVTNPLVLVKLSPGSPNRCSRSVKQRR